MISLKNIGYGVGLGVICLAVGWGLGYFESPDKVRIQTQVITKDKIITKEHTKVITLFDPNTGRVIKKVEETDTKNEDDHSTEKDKTKVVEKSKSHYAVKVGITKDIFQAAKPYPRVGVETRVPIFDTFIGAEGDISTSNPNVGIYIREGF